jgi:UDP-3-O-[3-hydroxymyristoyl] N-acetylglucosamine deacetylase
MSLQPRQTTLAQSVSMTGVGLHTGARSTVTLLPAAADAGIVFVFPSGARLPATAEHVVSTQRGTTLGADGVEVATVEHLLSALYGLGVDNVEVALDGKEIPAGDGSAQDWVELIGVAGVEVLEAHTAPLRLARAVWVGEGETWAVATPAMGLSLAVGIDFGDAVVGRQELWLPITPERYAVELAPARTFGFLHEVEALRAAGLARGGTEENALVVTSDGYLTPPRFPDEAVRHKAMDAVGDLALCGGRLEASVTLIRPSHRLVTELARALRAQFGES